MKVIINILHVAACKYARLLSLSYIVASVYFFVGHAVQTLELKQHRHQNGPLRDVVVSFMICVY